jgi:hypothetical protein
MATSALAEQLRARLHTPTPPLNFQILPDTPHTEVSAVSGHTLPRDEAALRARAQRAALGVELGSC